METNDDHATTTTPFSSYEKCSCTTISSSSNESTNQTCIYSINYDSYKKSYLYDSTYTEEDNGIIDKQRAEMTMRNSIARRNARERRRIKHVNSAFDHLRKRVPTGVKSKKISKVEILRSAIEYIRALENIINEQDGERKDVKRDNDVIIQQDKYENDLEALLK